MMWIVFAREPLPDSAYWPGRRWLAGLDAVLWPGIGLVMFAEVPVAGGIALPLVGALLVMSASMRLHTAFCANHRYRFTTWRWGRIAAALVLQPISFGT
jgi:hypothetical protein